MRVAALVITLLLPLSASAGPFHDVVVQPAKHAPPGTKHFVTTSHLIYLNPCMPNGCNVSPGFDDSRSDHSSIPQQPSHLAAYPWGQQSWGTLVQCVKDMYSPFDIQITDVDPGNTAHFEVMVGGNSTDIGIQGAGGVAPFIPCDGQLEDNVISFVFAASTQNLDFLCWAAAQETSHVFGLDHELDAKDPMTYLSPPIKKPGFQNEAADCGESTPRDCWCTGTKQNSAQYLLDTFGPAQLDAPVMAITSPAEGAWLKPGFTVRATATSQLSITSSDLQIDGQAAQSLTSPPLVFATSSTLAGGDHTITVAATDKGPRTFSATVGVHVVGACVNGGCTGGFKCAGGYCLPGADVAGGLGATCTDSSACISGSCASDGNDHLCTTPCDSGMTCPDGFTCLSSSSSGSGVCWPGAPSNGGCTTSSDSSSLLALGGIGALLAIVRRRRPPR
jgi:uncharacterized protein (TIGR03382 family)